jgi:hypothetical protein
LLVHEIETLPVVVEVRIFLSLHPNDFNFFSGTEPVLNDPPVAHIPHFYLIKCPQVPRCPVLMFFHYVKLIVKPYKNSIL